MVVKKKGMMLVTVLLITSLLMIFFLAAMSMISNNSSASTLSVEREMAMMAVKAGMQKVLFEANNNYQSQGLDFSLPADETWHELDKIDKYELSYKYKYANGVAVVGGRVKISDGKYIQRFVKVSYVVEPMGVMAAAIKTPAITAGKPGASITSVHSFQTQLPFDAWIGCPQILPDAISYKGTVVNTNASNIVLSYANVFKKWKPTTNLGISIGIPDSEWNSKCYYDNLCFKWKDDFTDWHSEIKDKTGIDVRGPNKANPVKFIDKLPDDGLYPTAPLINNVTGKNLWFIPLQQTLYCNGDLVLSGNALVLVTGNLVVRGNIRGNGIVIVLSNLYFAPKSSATKGVAESGNLIVYASGNISVISPITLSFNSELLAGMPPDFLVRLTVFAREKKLWENFDNMTFADFRTLLDQYNDYCFNNEGVFDRQAFLDWYEKWVGN